MPEGVCNDIMGIRGRGETLPRHEVSPASIKRKDLENNRRERGGENREGLLGEGKEADTFPDTSRRHNVVITCTKDRPLALTAVREKSILRTHRGCLRQN